MPQPEHPAPDPLASPEGRLAWAEARLAALMEQSLAGVLVYQDGRFTRVNRKFAAIFGYEVDEVQGRLGPRQLATKADEDAVAESFERIARGETESLEFTFSGLGKDGAIVEVQVSGARSCHRDQAAVVGLAIDVTHQRRAERQLTSLAFYDPLTGLPNRALLLDRLNQALAAARRYKSRFGLLMMDLDGFKAVNDELGHEVGDTLLKAVADRLHGCIREFDTAARLGGDEFMLLLPHLRFPADAGLIAARAIKAVAQPFTVNDRDCRLGMSVGICIGPDDGWDMDTLMARADSAMYQAKSAGKGGFCYFGAETPEMKPASIPALSLGEEHGVGVREIDEQHLQLGHLVNRMGEALKNADPPELLQARLSELVEFTRFHFETEERLMEAYDSPRADVHRQEHRKLLDDVQSLSGTLDRASLTLTMYFLKEWLTRHILTLDKTLGRDLVSKGRR